MLAFLAVIFIIIYIPPVQDLIVNQVLTTINQGDSDMHISAKRLRLSFPLTINADSVSMLMPGMEINVAHADANVSLLHLLKLDVVAKEVSANDVIVNIGTPDSTLYMRSAVTYANVKDASIGLRSSKINVPSIMVSGGNIAMIMTPDSVPAAKTESAPQEWDITLERVQFEQIDFGLQMLPTIDTLACSLPIAELKKANINLKNSTITVNELSLDSVDATYIVPISEYIAAHPAPVLPPDTSQTTPWDIHAAKIRLNNSHATYATRGTVPTGSNFEPLYIEASQINIAIDSLANRGTEIYLPLSKFSARERCGVALNASGLFTMDSLKMQAQNFNITTPTSSIKLDAMMGLETDNPPLQANLKASISTDDIRRLVPKNAVSITNALPQYSPVELRADIDGRMNNLHIEELSAEIPSHISLALTGDIADYTDINKANGDIAIMGDIANGNFIKPALLNAKTGNDINLPPLKIAGTTTLNRGLIDGSLKALTDSGDVALIASWNNHSEAYNVDLQMREFPIQSILPNYGIRNIDATVALTGEGIDIFSPSTNAKGSIALNHIEWQGRRYTDIQLNADIANGHADIDATSHNRNANFHITANGNLADTTYRWQFSGDVKQLNLYALAITDTICEGSVTLSGSAEITPTTNATQHQAARPMALSADINIADLYWHIPGEAVNASNIAMQFTTDSFATAATVRNNNLAMDFHSPTPLDSITKRLTWAMLAIDRDITRRRLSVDTIQRALPHFNFTLSAGDDNILANYLLGSDISFKHLQLIAKNDSTLSLNAISNGIRSGETKIDTIAVDMRQRGEYILYDAAIHNRPGTFDQFANVTARGYVNADRMALLFKQENLAGETGYSLGAMLSIANDNTVKLRFVPYHPIIGYKNWEINKDNFISFNLASRHIDANIDLHNDDSSLKLYTEHNHAHHNDSVQEDVILKVDNVKLADWIALNPFAPPITGALSTDMRLSWLENGIEGNGIVSLNELTYGRKRVGTFDLDLNVTTNASGTLRANTSLMVNGVKAMTAVGNLNDSTAANPFLLDFKMIQFPLSVLNPFLPQDMASLSGTLNGELDITGDMASPIFNGALDFDSTFVNMEMLGTKFHFSNEKIPVENSVIKFNNFTIAGVNENPLNINGEVDLSSLTVPKINLDLNAKNMQIVGSKKSRKSQVYGKAYVNIDGKVNGSMQFLDVDAALSLLPGSNLTYIMADAATQITSRSNQDMVKFVNFADTNAVIEADTVVTPSMLMNIDARLNIANGTTITVELDPSGNSKAQIQSTGTFNYTLDYMEDERFTGRLNINNGFVRYAVPVIGEKSFTFTEGSYVEFNGDMLNPILNVKATDDIKANVSQDGNSRVVNFDVMLSVGGTLNEMDVAFDLECPDDISIANELQAMSPEQRANQAMNLLLYNVYRGGNTQSVTSGNVGTNALFNFLESQINTWASSAIKGVDISFGINQYDKTVDGTNTSAMSYSYRVSKSLFDERFKIVVGGNYTTDANADENFAQNLIADISFEYTLNKSGSMYVRLFRHTGYESILEGEITQTGVGFVYKKKINRIGDIFKFVRRIKKHLLQR